MTNRDFSASITVTASEYNKEKDYWLKKLAGDLQKSCFPYDHIAAVAKAVKTSRDSKSAADPAGMAKTIGKKFTREVFSKLMQLCKNSDYVLHMIFIAGVAAILGKYTGNRDIIMGIPIYKQEKDAEFLNTVLPLRIRLEERMSFKKLLIQVRQAMVDANENQNYPIEALLFQLGLPYTGDEFPLFDVAVLLENIHDKKYILHTHPNVIFSFVRTVDAVEGGADYNPLKYDKSTMDRVLHQLISLVGKAIFHLDIPVSRLDILTGEEKRQLLVDFNATSRDYPAEMTINELFEEQVARAPEQIALTYEGMPMSYGRLNEEADALAAYLCSQGVETEEPIATMVDNSHQVIAAILAILKTGGAYVPLNAEYPLERKKYILNDCNARILLTNYTQPCDYIGDIKVIHPEDNVVSRNQPTGGARGHTGNRLAYIMYTSGSTGTPKGVMVEHRNVVRLVKNTDYIEFNEGDSILLTGALEFDASTFEIWGALLNGLTLHLVHKDTILSPDLLKQSITTYGVTTMWMTSPFFNQILDTDIEVFAGLKNLLVGGDVLSPSHINRVRKCFPKLIVLNGYGPTENTTFSTTYRVGKEYRENIPIGKPISNSTAYILDQYNLPVPIGVPGELLVGGDGLSRGYLNNPELTAEKFVEQVTDALIHGDRCRQVLYRTGDLAQWLPDGNIEFLGRSDHQVKIRGFRIEPGEIENYLLRMADIREAIVVVKKNTAGEKYLCAYVVSAQEKIGTLDTMDLKKRLSRRLPDYMVPTYWISMEEIPLTANGKVDRSALPEPETTDPGAAYVLPTHPVEEKFVEIWSEVLKIEKKNIGIDSDFFELGGHSLKATVLIAKLHEAFGVKLPLAEVFRTPTIRELAEYIVPLTGNKFVSLQPVEKKEYYALSSTQKRLYILQEMIPENTAYNVPMIYTLEGNPDRQKMEEVFKKLIHRHEGLRTSFPTVKEKPVQVIHKEVDFKIGYNDLSAGNHKKSGKISSFPDVQGFIRPFVLSRVPLIRMELLKIKADRHIMILDLHHIITDAPSLVLFIEEFKALFAGEKPGALKVQYKDYSAWQNSKMQREVLKEQEKYWLKQFEHDPPVLDLPLDFLRPSLQNFEGGTLRFELPSQQIQSLNHLASEHEATLYMVILTIYYILLYRLSGQEDIVVGTPIAARRHVDLEQIIGMFVNTLAMRNYPSGDRTFSDFLKEVKERTLEAFENQEYQFEDLVEIVELNRDVSRNPIFDTVFSWQNAGIPEIRIPGLTLAPYEVETTISKFDLVLSGEEMGDSIIFYFDYCSKLFKKETIERFVTYFRQLVASVVEDRDGRIAGFEIIPPMEKKRLLEDFNDTATASPRDKTIHELFEEQVLNTPDNIALTFKNVQLSYRDLNEKADRLVALLGQRGVSPGSIIGLLTERSLEMIIGILGILKAGAAYLPINPKNPEERVKYILADSRINVLLSEPGTRIKAVVEKRFIDIIDISDLLSSSTLTPISTCQVHSTNMAYLIYTSGSTGNPKGVPITHANFSPLIHWGYQQLAIGTKDRVIQNLSYYFDWSVWEIFIALTTGASLYMITDEILLNPEAEVDFIRENDITVLHITPTQYSYLLNTGEELTSLKYLFIGAEKLTVELVKRSIAFVSRDCRLFNMYGPTEATIISAVLEINPGKVMEYQRLSGVPIGKAVGNNALVVLDSHMNLCPIGVSGELYIAGDAVAQGYLNNPELTAEKFNRDRCLMTDDRIYRTGDRVRWLPDGTVEFLGRVDYQVKIRGYRIEPGEIENHLLKHQEIKESVVITKQNPEGEKYLCAYIVSETDLEVSCLKEYLSGNMPEYMVPSYFVQLERMPLTPNGKIERKALPEPQLTDRVKEYNAPQNRIEKKLVEIWSEILNVEKNVISVDANFFQLGGHSLNATEVAAKIHKILKIKIPLGKIFSMPTIRALSGYIKKTSADKYISIEPVEEREFYALSSAQERMYVLMQMYPQNTAYNIVEIVELNGDQDRLKMEQVFIKLIQRHEILRTSFQMINDESTQKIHAPGAVDFKIEFHQTGEKDDYEKILTNFIKPFDLAQAPLFRVSVIKLAGGEKRLLLLDIHHIIADGVSMEIIVQEFAALYRGENLPDSKLRYRDYSEWQKRLLASGKVKSQEAYWLKQFEKEVPMLSLPTDYVRPAVQTFEGDTITAAEIGSYETGKLKEIAVENGATLNMILLAIFYILLLKYTNKEDIVVGIPIAGRRHNDLHNLIGMFVNMLPMRHYPSYKKKFVDFLNEVKESSIKAYENQDFQFDMLIERLELDRDVNRNSLFEVVFLFQSYNGQHRVTKVLEAGDLPIKPYRFKFDKIRFDLLLNAVETREEIHLKFNYCRTLFKTGTIETMGRNLKNIIAEVIGKPGARLSEIEMVSDAEELHLLKKVRQRENVLLVETGRENRYPSKNREVRFNF